MVNQTFLIRNDTPIDILEKYSTDGNPDIRIQVASHKNASADILRKLAKDTDKRVRLAVTTQNPNITSSLLDELGTDWDPDIRIQVASHKNASADILRKLAKDTDKRVRLAVATQNPNITSSLLDELCTDENIEIRKLVADSSITSPDTLRRLSIDSNPQIRSAVLKNSSVTSDILEKLASDISVDIRIQVAKNVNTRPDDKSTIER